MTLGGYLTKVRTLLRDSTSTLHPQSDLIAHINEARRLRDLDTRLVRKVVGFSFVQNQADYSLAAIDAGGTFLRGVTAAIPREIISINFIPNGGVAGGIGIRIPLGRQPYSWISSLISLSWPNYPTWYSFLGHDQVVVAPPPAFAYPAEWDLVGIYPDLTAPDDIDPMPDPWNDPVPYLAASIAKDNAQRFDEAAQYLGQYKMRMAWVREGIFAYSIRNPGADRMRGAR